jgi:hypothetical protein
MCKLSWALNALLAIAVVVLAYLLFVPGKVMPASDGRTAILLAPGERDFVLAEMRAFLDGVQGIAAGAAQNDMKAVGESARKVGMAVARNVPVSLMSKLPMEFKGLGMATHKAFDDLGIEAETMGDAKVVTGKLADLLNNCSACHGTYRIDPDPAAAR